MRERENRKVKQTKERVSKRKHAIGENRS